MGNSTDVTAKGDGKPEFSLIDESFLKSRIYTIRGIKVMLDADLAEIYGYSTSRFNQQVKNNIERFADDFRFQLTKEEMFGIPSKKRLISKILTSNRGGTRKTPYAFTEQGIYMLMTVLKGDLAIRQSMALIRLFKQMKDYIVAENQQLLGNTEIAAQTVQNTREIVAVTSKFEALSGEVHDVQDRLGKMDLNLQKVMENFIDPSTYKHFLILNGQKLEADVAYTQIYGMAKKSVIVIDNYVDVKTLDLLRNVAKNVSVIIFTDQYGKTYLTDSMLADFRTARPDVPIEPKPAGNKFHDRYILLDFGFKNERIFHCGASSKDAGGKITTIAQLEDTSIYRNVFSDLLNKP